MRMLKGKRDLSVELILRKLPYQGQKNLLVAHKAAWNKIPFLKLFDNLLSNINWAGYKPHSVTVSEEELNLKNPLR